MTPLVGRLTGHRYQQPGHRSTEPRTAQPAPRPGVVRRLVEGRVRDLLLRLPPSVQPERVRRRQEWSIGLYHGQSLTTLGPALDVANPVLTRSDVTDVPADIVADPFLVEHDGSLQLFFELLNRRSGRGEIGLATEIRGGAWAYRGRVLAEPFHLSYPHVLWHTGEAYLVPESSEIGEVRLYRAAVYPTKWVHIATLLSGGTFYDPTPFHHGGRWWLYAATGIEGWADTLRLYHADALTGPWQEHPASPIRVDDPAATRPAGRVVMVDGMPVRFGQDGTRADGVGADYGRRVCAFSVTRLTRDSYEETPLGPVLQPSGQGWNSTGMHHLDAMEHPERGWLAAVDGRSRGRPRRVATGVR